MTSSLSQLYRHKLTAHQLTPDPAQLSVLEKLSALSEQLSKPKRLFAPRPRGLYIHGPIGRGKSMLMDLFFEAAPIEKKRRVHFNAFMLDMHHRLHAARQTAPRDPLLKVVEALAREARLLCLDEFQVNDIGDAMILGRLFERLLDRGVVIVATSNAAPDQLYRNGLQRALFLPFIALLQRRLDIVEIGAGVDYRLARLAGRQMWFTPDDATAAAGIDALFADLTEGKTPAPETIPVDGRDLFVPLAAGGVARFSFVGLCDQPLGAADYLALADRFAVLIVEHIPLFEPENRNPALRFITLIDQLYERHARLIASAAAPVSALYPPDGPCAFEFARAASRLIEMQSRDYLR